MGNCCAPGSEDAEVNGAAAAAVTPQDNTMSKNSPPASAAASPAGVGSASTQQSPANRGLTFELAVTDLEKAEKLAYGSVFANFGPSASGYVPVNSELLIDYVSANTCLPYTDIDTVLLTAAQNNDEMAIKLENFLKIMQDNSIQEGMVLERFLGLSDNGEAIQSSECRSGLLMLKEELGAAAASVGEARWELVFDSVMANAEATVNMDAWTDYCRKVARIAHVTHAAKL
eukprot:CAMPEP_0176069682 /NCGR_PEP_ID=MMETSP0120_2-20121206/34793_1 /TAXON_ID=160619 /ORGANISM="Kryptoperidinium foliaceum, Strain CCMP 1326" /LENGTH=229 /DNA_ID=CAMNT_0017403319 /DNA_START=80 /DNA_END=769 /DNA_ORIENTATION=+